MDLLELVGLEDQARKLPSSASGGRQQRAAIVRSLVAGGRTIVMVTHNPGPAVRTRRTVHMVDGRILVGMLEVPSSAA